jgi:hypothetical protein
VEDLREKIPILFVSGPAVHGPESDYSMGAGKTGSKEVKHYESQINGDWKRNGINASGGIA